MSRRAALSLIAACAVAETPRVVAQVTSLADAINKAGAQRMLSQRMTKAYLGLGMGVAVDRARAVIEESMARFDRQLVELSAFAPRPAIKSTFAQLESVWSSYKTMLVGHAPDRDRAPALIDLDGRVLALAHQGTVQLEQESGGSLGRVVNISGRQRMLSQRAAKYFFAQVWKVNVPNADAELLKARDEFTSALAQLERSAEATAAIRQELDMARKQWVFFDVALAHQSNVSPRAAENVFVSSENLLSVMDRVTEMYARLTG